MTIRFHQKRVRARTRYSSLSSESAFVIGRLIPNQEYTLTSIFFFSYTWTMKTFSTALTEPNNFHMVELFRDDPQTVGQITSRLGLQTPPFSTTPHCLST